MYPEVSSDKPLDVLPMWLIRHICHPENHRAIGKMPKSWYSANQAIWQRGQVDRRLPGHYRPATQNIGPVQENVLSITERPAHLNPNDYRLWAECRELHQRTLTRLIVVRCRWCQKRFPLREFENGIRELHKETCWFTWNLREIFAKVVARGQCAACGQHTRQQRWGLPLCNTRCERAWMFAEQHNEVLGRAIIQCRLENRLKEHNATD